jgi:transcriptional regulator with XRE-family HTH domain
MSFSMAQTKRGGFTLMQAIHSRQAAERFCELLTDVNDQAGSRLGSQLNVSRATVYRWRQRIDSVDTIGMLADYFGVPITEFLREKEL